MPQSVTVTGGPEPEEWIPASGLSRSEVGIVVDRGRTACYREGMVLIRTGIDEVAALELSGWEHIRVLDERGLRVRRLRAGERIIIEGG